MTKKKYAIICVGRNIKIQWFSNEAHIIPEKDNPQGDIYAPDFYDKTGEHNKLISLCLTYPVSKSNWQLICRFRPKEWTKMFLHSREILYQSTDDLILSRYLRSFFSVLWSTNHIPVYYKTDWIVFEFVKGVSSHSSRV